MRVGAIQASKVRRADAGRDRRQRLRLAVLSCGGIGCLPRGAATGGALAGAALDVVLRPNVATRVAWVVAVTCAGQVLSRPYISASSPDPGFIVIDELAGVWTALVPVPITAFNAIVGAVVFRLLDRFKPGPIGAIDRRGGRFGVMADDLAAGVATALALWWWERIGG